VLAAVPNHPRARLRLGELAASSPVAVAPAGAAPTKSAPAVEPDPPRAEPLEAKAAQPAGEEEDDTAPQLAAVVPPPAQPKIAPAIAVAERVAEPEGEMLGAADFDLAAELSGALDEGGTTRGGTKGADGEAFEEVFAAFKAGVKREVADGDTEAHYDLGIAYKEMGLLEDAIGEFRVALRNPVRKLACLHLMGVCALDLGRSADAIAHLSEALAAGSLPAEQEAALRVDLGRAYRAAGDRGRARAELEAARAADPGFGGVGELLAELDASPEEPAAPASGETFESFDDLIESEAVQPAPRASATAAPHYESFDELIDDDEAPPAESADAAAELQLDEPVASDPPSAATIESASQEPREPAEAEAPEPAAAPPRAPAAAPVRRKKKISFV
jgi:tetratricopeptide (TPR) repeat protein